MTRYLVGFTAETEAQLLELEAGLRVDRPEAIRDALSLYVWAFREIRAGNKLLIKRGDQVAELVPGALARELGHEAGGDVW
jgi:hypothetical protein